MTPSIRTFLLINLLLSVTLITSLAIIGNLFLAHKDMQLQQDANLIHNALRISAFFSQETSKEEFIEIQKNLVENLKLAPKMASNQKIKKIDNQTHLTSGFQIWNKHGQLVLHSPMVPNIPFSTGKIGLSTIWINGYAWRVSTVYNAENGLTVMVAEQSNYQQTLENKLTQDSIFIMLISYPFLGFLIWIIVGRGLDTLKKVAQEVKNRAPSYLKPVDIDSVPSEIQPLVTELDKLFQRLQEAFDREKRFAADAAHELKTPLAALSAQTQVALKAKTAKDRNEALFKVLSGVERSAHVIHQLLILSRMLPEENIENPKAIHLANAASEVAAQLAPQAIAKNIDLELLTPDSLATILGNETFIHILMRNLIDNAIRYSKENGFVKIKIEESDRHITFHVIDNGPGIPKTLRKRVFERFFRVIGNQATGSGLGLGIVQQIAKLHQAKIKLLTPESSVGLEVQVIFLKK